MRPERVRYSVTTIEPGASEVFTHDGTLSPFSTAFFASSPAATSTDGFEVLVQLVIAAITTLPWVSAWSSTTCSSTTSCCESMPAGCPPSLSQRAPCLGGTLRPGDARLDRCEVEFQNIGVFSLGRVSRVEESLLLAIGLNQANLLRAASAEAEIAQRLFINREDAAGGAVLGAHVGDGGAVSESEIAQAGPEELDELSYDAFLAQHLGHGKDEVGSGRTFAQPVLQAHADHLRDQHGHRLAEHGSLGFDSAYAPAQHAEAVDHGSVRVGADQRVGISQRFAGFAIRPDEDHARQVLEVDLVHDAGIGRHDGEVLERGLSPAQEGVALFVARELECGVELERLRRAELIHLYGVVDDQLGRLQRVDQLGIAAQRFHGVAHGSEIDYRRHAGEILQQHAAGHEGDLLRGNGFAGPGRERAHVVGLHRLAVFAAEQVLQQDAERVGQVTGGAALLFQSVKTVDLKLALAHAQDGATAKAVHG